LPGVTLENFWYALLVAAVLSLVNVLLKPLLVILTIPVTIVTFGLFLLVINAFIIMLVDYVVPGFEVRGFWWALAFSLILSIFNSMFSNFSKEDTRGRNKMIR
jgi:putative membrane protein